MIPSAVDNQQDRNVHASNGRSNARYNERCRKVAAVCRRLGKVYGPVETPGQRPVLEALAGTILSQNRSDSNSHAAFEELLVRCDALCRLRLLQSTQSLLASGAV